MALKVTHDKIDDIPEAYRELYTEKDGKYHLTGVEGIKTQADIDRLTTSLNKERDEHKTTKEKLRIWDGLEHDEVRGKLDRFTELEIAAKGNKEEMDAKLEELVEARINSRIAPVDRENKSLKAKLEEAQAIAQKLTAEKIQRQIGDKIGEACTAAKVISEAQPDVVLLANAVFEVTEDGAVLTKENPFGVSPGLTPDLFLQEMQDKRPHWWPAAQGGGAKGAGAGGGFSQNPWSNEHWNLTKQGEIIKTQGMEKANMMAKAAGTVVGGAKPVAKK